ncbi:unnamed protein product [Parascedosporium putredinis]|uniref:TACO1/YebC-like N-terminal domain-containing protein n=1 Tax=Parascedosporium putredinis TaxID=1442378 RepID=A0A9P1HCZ6_9PEZI|nr:unnamed protein product [Parascedosporium putredinis]CAI8003832.1 unnamed protein product [Parascedosporium putredinis]
MAPLHLSVVRCRPWALLGQALPSSTAATLSSRSFTASARLGAGHNKWSKIRHEKGAADRKRSVQNIAFAKAIADASRKGGPKYKDGNPALAAAVAAAKAANVTSAFIERAIARGQARSQSGAALEKSPSRPLQDLNSLHRGRVVLELDDAAGAGGAKTCAEWEEEVMAAVLGEEGVLDVDVEGREATVWTEAAATGAVVAVAKEALGVEPRSVDLVWRPKEDLKVAVDSKVTASYINAEKGDIPEELWARIQDNLILP